MAKATAQIKILVPGSQPMVALLGQRDELLKLVEAAFDPEIVVRGNEITITGPDEEAEHVGRLFEELITLMEKGHELTPAAVGQTIDMVKGGEASPSEVEIARDWNATAAAEIHRERDQARMLSVIRMIALSR